MAQPVQPVTARGERTRQRLLRAAEAEFGERGFHQASIGRITRRAGVAQGTFYLYFPSKEAIMRALVEHLSQELRQYQRSVADGAPDRLTAERQGLRRFLDFALSHGDLYRILMESQFVDEALHRQHYQKLIAGYGRRLAEAQARGEIRDGDPAALATALVGIAHFMGLCYADWSGRLPDERTLETVLDFITDGLAPPGGR